MTNLVYQFRRKRRLACSGEYFPSFGKEWQECNKKSYEVLKYRKDIEVRILKILEEGCT